MQLTDEAREAIKNEVHRFAQDLHLSDDQKLKLRSALETAREKVETFREHREMSKMEVLAKVKEARGPLRERVTAFLTPEQLAKWDTEIAKAKSFLGIAS
jgi:DNA-binding MurR/RpiR family transcriptional regulator